MDKNEQKRLLLEAVENAEGTKCQYVSTQGKPECVIAQLLYRLGMSEAELAELDNTVVAVLYVPIKPIERKAQQALAPFPPKLIIGLQQHWDRGYSKDKLKTLIEAYYP
ncbi:hypothetical protein [Myxococcus phage Mx1]|nr:hypothetical protein [Myxococcus phage Mx1]